MSETRGFKTVFTEEETFKRSLKIQELTRWQGGELRMQFRKDEAFALTEAECAWGRMQEFVEDEESRGQLLIDSSTMRRYLNLIPHALEGYQGFLTRKDFLFTQIIQVI